jgi:hypothetical protein
MRLLIILFLVVAPVVLSQKQPTNVLFIGNSYTHMNNLYKIYQNLANSKGKNVTADTLAVSGSSLQGHTLRANTYKKMKAKNWDYVFIQGYSRELSRDSATIEQQTVPYAKQLIDSIKTYNPCARIYYYMTWGYADGFKDSIPDDTYLAMQERIQRGYLQLSESTGGYPIAPVGMVWKNVREAYPELNLYAPDNAHPSIFGSYVAACTFYTAIYKESPVEGTCPKKIEDTQAKNIQEKAAEYTLTYYPMYNLDTLQIVKPEKDPKLDFDIKEKWLSITIVNKSYGGSQYFWDFGDGNTSTKRTPKHYYKKPGKYIVTLYVKSNCYWYKLKKTIKVSDKVKHGNSPAPATKKTN